MSKFQDLDERRKRIFLKNGNALQNIKAFFQDAGKGDLFSLIANLAAQTVDNLPPEEIDRLMKELDDYCDSNTEPVSYLEIK